MGISKEKRRALMRIQFGTCFWCPKPITDGGTVEHLIPRSKGGRGGKNIVLACKSCNSEKGDLLPEAFIKKKLKAFEGFIRSAGFREYGKVKKA